MNKHLHPLTEKILALDGLTLPVLRQCVYQWRIRHGLCHLAYCSQPAEPGSTACAKHAEIHRASEANRRLRALAEKEKQRKQEKKAARAAARAKVG
jgi:hypothetical protein